jgi:hypothetical protein
VKEIKDASEGVKKDLDKLLQIAKDKFIHKGIVGQIQISYSIGPFTSGETIDVSSDDLEEIVEGDSIVDAAELSEIFKKAVPPIDAGIIKLQLRARERKSKVSIDNITLFEAISISDPFLGAFGISLQLSATVKSLLVSIQAEDASKVIDKILTSVEAKEDAEKVTNG